MKCASKIFRRWREAPRQIKVPRQVYLENFRRWRRAAGQLTAPCEVYLEKFRRWRGALQRFRDTCLSTSCAYNEKEKRENRKFRGYLKAQTSRA